LCIIGIGGISMKELTLRIDGMHCGACVRRVTQALQKIENADVKEVRVGAARVAVPGTFPETAITEALAKSGYSAHLEQ
jgi:copper chaperone CopZ